MHKHVLVIFLRISYATLVTIAKIHNKQNLVIFHRIFNLTPELKYTNIFWWFCSEFHTLAMQNDNKQILVILNRIFKSCYSINEINHNKQILVILNRIFKSYCSINEINHNKQILVILWRFFLRSHVERA